MSYQYFTHTHTEHLMPYNLHSWCNYEGNSSGNQKDIMESWGDVMTSVNIERVKKRELQANSMYFTLLCKQISREQYHHLQVACVGSYMFRWVSGPINKWWGGGLASNIIYHWETVPNLVIIPQKYTLQVAPHCSTLCYVSPGIANFNTHPTRGQWHPLLHE